MYLSEVPHDAIFMRYYLITLLLVSFYIYDVDCLWPRLVMKYEPSSYAYEIFKTNVSHDLFILLGRIHAWDCYHQFIFVTFNCILQEVTLVKEGGSLGFSIIGGTDHSCMPFGASEPGIFISHVSTRNIISVLPTDCFPVLKP